MYWESSTISPIVDSRGEITHYLAVKEDITEKIKAEEELRKFRIISDRANFGNAISDLDGNLLYSNDYFAKMHGYEVREILGRNLSILHSESQLNRVSELIGMLKINGEFSAQEVWRTRKDGTAFPSMMNAFIIYDKDNKSSFMSATVIDITQQKEAEEAVRKSEDSLNYAQEIANMGSWSLDMLTNKVKWSKNYFRIMGLDPSVSFDERDHFREILHPDDLHLLEEKLEEIHHTRRPTSVDLRLVMADGSIKWVQNNIVPVFDGDNLVALEGVNTDITDKKTKDAEIHKLSLAVEQSPVLVVITDLSGDIIYVNHAFEETTGYNRQEVIGKNPRILKSAKQDVLFYKKLWDTIVAGKEWKGELINRKKSGEFYWEEMSITPIRDVSGKITNYLAIKQDITQNKANEQKILELNAGLEQKIVERTAQLTQTNAELAREIEERISIEKALILKSGELESFFSVALDLLCIADTTGHFLKVNKAWENTLGYTTEELASKLFLDFVHPDDIEATLGAMVQLSEQNLVFSFINRYRTRNGEYKFIEWRSAPSGERIYAAARDITDRKRKEDFELELLQLSAQLTGIQPSGINDAINMSLERIGKYTGTDRAFIFEIDPGEETFSNTYEWDKDHDAVRLNAVIEIPVSLFPMWWEELRQGRYIAIPDIEDLPETWISEKRIIQPLGDKSILVIPMFSENKLIGYAGLATTREKREFSIEEINLLTIWSSMLTSLINNFHTESLLEQTRKNYETFFNTLDDFLLILDYDGNIIHFNNTAQNRLEYSLEELVGESVLAVFPVDRREEASSALIKLISGSSETFTIPLLSKSGKIIPVETRAFHGFWNNKPVIFKTSKDISQIKLSEAKFATAFQSNSAMMAISLFDEGNYIDVNNTFLENLGYAREEIIGKTNKELGLLLDDELRNEMISDLGRNIPVRKIEVSMRTKSGEIKIGFLSADTIFLGDKKCLLTVTIDISERKRMEEQLKAAQEEANRANVAKSEFLSRMSHELRTPMNSILGFAQLLEMGELNVSQKKGVSHIKKSGKHLLDLINEVLDISRIEAGRLSLSLEPVKVSDVIQEMIDIVRQPALEREVSIETDASNDKTLFLMSDKQRLKQILLNLLNNAIKYNKKGGSVVVETRLMPPNQSGVKPVRVSVKDSGLGISTSDIPRLFYPFERIGAEKTEIEGTGLGLSVVKKLTVAMGGEMGVESTLGEGSTFWVEFPWCEGGVAASGNNGTLVDSGLRKKDIHGVILYLEDNASNIDLVEEILTTQRSNIHLLTNAFGRNAVPLALENKPDLILLDLNLSDIHGSEVLKTLQANKKTSEIPVVVISADAMPQQISRLMELGARRYVVKPLDVNVLLQIVDEFITKAE